MNKVALVVDDTSYIREDIKDILEEQGYKVFEAGDGLEAVEMYKKVNPAKEAGAKAFLSKPFDEDEFMNEFSKLFL